MTSLATELQLAGRNNIGLSQDEPDFDTRANIRRTAIAAIQRGETRDTVFDGRMELKRALFNALVGTITPGDEVVIPAPLWVFARVQRLQDGPRGSRATVFTRLAGPRVPPLRPWGRRGSG
jgi:aspartate/methionine/tyrosine aminotransferase